jgi:hypothetical protein
MPDRPASSVRCGEDLSLASDPSSTGPIVALRTGLLSAKRTASSKGRAHAGLTAKRQQSGEVDYDGGISECGDGMLRMMP